MISSSNASSLVYANALNSANAQAAKSSERISTTLKINRASDDPAGLVKAMGFKTEVGSYTRVLDNLSNTNEVIQNVSSTLTDISSIIDNMSALALKATTETDTTVLAAYQTSFSNYRDEITNLIADVTVDGSSVMDGTTTTISAQVGIDAGDTRTFTMIDASTSTLGISSLDISSGAAAAITALNTAKFPGIKANKAKAAMARACRAAPRIRVGKKPNRTALSPPAATPATEAIKPIEPRTAAT